MSAEIFPTITPFLPALLPGGEPGILALQIQRRLLSQMLGGLAPLILEGERTLYCADSMNAFDPYAFSTYARRRGFDPGPALDRIFVTRSFTIHQLEAVAAEMLLPLAHLEPRPLVALLGLDHLFLEETLPLRERRQVLERILAHLCRLRREGMTMLVTYDPPRPGHSWWQPLIVGSCQWSLSADDFAPLIDRA